MAQTPLATSPFHFTGEIRDWNGWQYHRARYYAPDLGVWMSLDPLETRNRYAYVNGNPINFVDRTGLLPCEQLGAACGAALALVPGDPSDIPVCSAFAACAIGVGIAATAVYLASQVGIDIDLPDISLPSVSAPDLSFLLDVLLPSPEMDPVLQAQVGNALCSQIAPGMPGSCNTGPVATPTPGAGGITDAERLALAYACNASLCAADIPVVTEIVVPTIRWMGTLTAQPWQDHRQFRPSPTPSQYPVPGLTPNPTQTATATRTPEPCDPVAFIDWWNETPLAGGVYNLPWYRYEQKVAREAPGTIYGTRPRRIPAGLETIDADGALSGICRLIDAKYGSPAPWANLSNEIRRYRLAIQVPNGVPGAQPSGLIIRTNMESLRSFFEDALRQGGFTINVDGFVQICTVNSQGIVTCQ